MEKKTILIIEDDPDIVELVQYNLERESFRVLSSMDGESGLKEASLRRPALIVLDLMLPGMDGLEVCRRLKQREETAEIPLVMLTAKGEENDIVLGFSMGADDYITKPFSPRELIARIKAVLRRGAVQAGGRDPDRIEVGPVVVDSARHEVLVDGKSVKLTLAEFRLCRALAARPGQVFTRDQLLDKITGGEVYIIDRNVDVHVRSIRKKFGKHKGLIVTIRGIGYKWHD